MSDHAREEIEALKAELLAARLAQQEADKQFAKWVALADEQEQRAIAAEVAQQEAERQLKEEKQSNDEAEIGWGASVKLNKQLIEQLAAAESRLTEAHQRIDQLNPKIASREIHIQQLIHEKGDAVRALESCREGGKGALKRKLSAADARAEEARTQLETERKIVSGLSRDCLQLEDDREYNASLCNTLRTELAEATRTHQALVTALRDYGKHPATCRKGVGIGIYKPPADAVCTCGIDAALTAASPVPQEPT